MSEKHIGKVIQVIGPVLDIQFKDGELPDLLNAIEIDNHGQKLVVEVAQLTGDNVARCIAMSSTDGLVRGTEAVDTGESPSATSAWAACSTCWVSRWTISPPPPRRLTGPSTAPLPAMRSSSPPPKFWRPASRSLTSSAPTPRAARSVCSAVPVSARPS